MYNKNGLKYFIHHITVNNFSYMELPIDLRIYIWDYAHTYSNIKCIMCDKVIINFPVQINYINNNENYTLVNGSTKCNNCYID